jgi:hypothetical protein
MEWQPLIFRSLDAIDFIVMCRLSGSKNVLPPKKQLLFGDQTDQHLLRANRFLPGPNGFLPISLNLAIKLRKLRLPSKPWENLFSGASVGAKSLWQS